MDFLVKDNIKEFTKDLDNIQKKQIPFATALSLTKTATACQEEIQKQIPQKFNVTKKWWLKQQPTGIKITPAKKDNLKAKVYTNAYFADIQEEGGVKTPKTHRLAVPSKAVAKKYRKSGGARELLDQKNVFKNKSGIFKKIGKTKLVLLYVLAKQAVIKKRFGFKEMAHKKALEVFATKFKEALERALQTMR